MHEECHGANLRIDTDEGRIYASAGNLKLALRFPSFGRMVDVHVSVHESMDGISQH